MTSWLARFTNNSAPINLSNEENEMTHLHALNLNLSNERIRLSNAKTDGEIELRSIWIAQLEKEIAEEERFLEPNHLDISDDDLLSELLS